MQYQPLDMPEVYLFKPDRFEDARGSLSVWINEEEISRILGKKVRFVQCNQTYSTQGVLRGLHWQLFPKGQDKLIQVLEGEIFDVVVDIREDSPTFLQYMSKVLTPESGQIWVPEGFAHGFYVCSESAKVMYHLTDTYSPEHECFLRWNDQRVGIPWPFIDGEGTISEPILSEKDEHSISSV